MNSSGLASNSLSSNTLGRLDALRTQSGVTSGVAVSSLDEASQMGPPQLDSSDHVSHQNHAPLHLGQHHHPHQQQHQLLQHHMPHHQAYPGPQTVVLFQESFGKLSETIAKLENEVSTMSLDMALLRHVLDFLNQRFDNLAQLLKEYLTLNKDMSSFVNSVQALQESHPFNVDETHDSVDSVDSVNDSVHGLVHDVHEVASALPSLQSLSVVAGVNGPGVNPGVLLESNMDPQLHQVAQAAVQAQSASKDRNDMKIRKRSFVKVNGNSAAKQQQQQHQQKQQQQAQIPQAQPQHQHSQQQKVSMPVSMPGLEVVNVDNMGGRKKPKITVDFLHNPMTVKEIYDEFTKGFRGQIPLREMDERFGKHEWRGDSRSKESKRFQRRKKLCDAIERGMGKYGKSGEEIISYIEEFRGDKSLTWVMNGNLPRDLIE